MNLLVVTQKVNKNDSNLGFFCVWIEKLAAQVDHLYVVCLEKGGYNLPSNVTVLSLGKENKKTSFLVYSFRFYRALLELRGKYDGVLIHMNPEYAIFGGLLWRVTGKKVLLWYVHKAVNFRLWLAEKFVTKIFTASKESFRLPSKKVEVVGHGILDIFTSQEKTAALLWVGRNDPSKNLPLAQAAARIVGMSLTIVSNKPQQELIYEYGRHQVLIHTSSTGSMDKVVLEALASGLIVITTSEAYRSLAENELKGVLFYCSPGNPEELANTIEKIYKDGILNTIPNQRGIDYVRKQHNLDNLVSKIIGYFKSV